MPSQRSNSKKFLKPYNSWQSWSKSQINRKSNRKSKNKKPYKKRIKMMPIQVTIRMTVIVSIHKQIQRKMMMKITRQKKRRKFKMMMLDNGLPQIISHTLWIISLKRPLKAKLANWSLPGLWLQTTQCKMWYSKLEFRYSLSVDIKSTK